MTSPTPRRRAVALPLPALLALLALLSTVAACGGGGASGDSSSRSIAGGGAAAESAARPDASRVAAADRTPTGAAVVSTGRVDLTTDDVPAARAQVLRIVTGYGGQVGDERASTGGAEPVAAAGAAGPPLTRTHLVLRVPSAHFDRAMAALSTVGDLVSSSRQATDVTTQVIDVHARVQAQARSVARIQTFFDRATSVRDVIAVETQLSRRQADLESLRRRAAYLDDQTTLSTITVDLARTSAAAPRRTHHTAFVAGLIAGWHGLTAVLAGLLRALGALLPFLLVLVPLTALGWAARRSLVSRRAWRPASTDESAQSG